MPRYTFQVESAALPGREESYTAWYRNTHIDEALTLPGFVACHWYTLAVTPGEQPRYLASYEVDAENPAVIMQTFEEAGRRFDIPQDFDPHTVTVKILELKKSKTRD